MLTSWLHRTVLAGLLLAAYLWAWAPARTTWTKHSAALLKQVVVASGPSGSITARPSAHVLRVATGDASTPYTAPAGVKFLLPAGFLILVAPRRPHLGIFFAGHLLLGALALGLLAGGAIGLPGGLGLCRFVEAYGVDAYSLAVPVLVLSHNEGVHKHSTQSTVRIGKQC